METTNKITAGINVQMISNILTRVNFCIFLFRTKRFMTLISIQQTKVLIVSRIIDKKLLKKSCLPSLALLDLEI